MTVHKRAGLKAFTLMLGALALTGCGGVRISPAEVTDQKLGPVQFMAQTSHFSSDPGVAQRRMHKAAEKHCGRSGGRVRTTEPYGNMGEWFMRFDCSGD